VPALTFTSADVVNEALALIGQFNNNQAGVQGTAPTFDTTPAGQAASYVYYPTVAAVQRQFEWDLGRSEIPLVPSGNTPPPGWTSEFVYPATALQILQVRPTTLADPNDPLPVNWSVGYVSSGVLGKMVWCNLTSALAVCSVIAPETYWDALFHQAVVRLLASSLGMALTGRPDTVVQMLESGAQFTALGEERSN
jgi:hypothetical protein